MANQQLFNRYFRIKAAEADLSGLDASFNITKALKQDTNAAEFVIYNLSDSNRKVLEAIQDVPVEIHVGYTGIKKTPVPGVAPVATSALVTALESKIQEAESLLFKGDVRQCFSQRQGPDWVTILRTNDGIKANKHSRLVRSYKEGTQLKIIAKDLINALQADGKNALLKLNKNNYTGALDAVLNSYTVAGSVKFELQKILDRFELNGSIQEGELILLGKNETRGTDIVLLSPETGLIGSPEPGKDKRIQIKALLQPTFAPGKKFKLEAAQFSGEYRIERVDFYGSTFGNEWYADITGVPI